MTGNEKISYHLDIINKMAPNGASPPLDTYWGEIVDVLSHDIGQTRELLMKCTPNEIDRMGGYFENVSEKLQSYKFIDLLRELQKKYPEIDIELDIQWAIDALD
ncbi:hypothetical protein [Paenibacillus sp. MMS18-CY102]|uniref:hypothetical protein n=1 Tax=Paenibacillus sp. MMS18-CY102 TaxID=2682849 RepID=UPI00136548E3|nr:hypothetical protein [Paenibacillus sp. MMS18-CY102]MWC30605.1 hypothetical protein [Paenibacillus sp. MMS18-CY102]